MFRIVYSSTLAASVGRAEIEAIIDDARENNGRADVTGAWLMHGRDCLSALEGPANTVRMIGERIWDDRRHQDFQIRDMRPVSQRLFQGSPLYFVDASDGSADALEAHDGLRWICNLVGGPAAFAANGLPTEHKDPD